MTKSVKILFRRFWSFGLVLALIGSCSLVIISCKKDSSTPAEDQDAVATLKLGTSATLGTYMTDASGNTLYFFARDVEGTNTCTSATCNPLWPVYYEANLKMPKALKAEDFATKTTTDGRPQTTYKGWPLYYYAPATAGVYTREAPGLTGGNAIGGIWHVVNPDYSIVLASKSVEDKTTHVVATKTYLTDVNGRALYFFAKDNTSPTTQATNCTSGCAAIWPALYLGVSTSMPSTLRTSDFATITRDANAAGIRTQLTYKGRPLYYYAGDNATRGRVEGHNFLDSGDLWFVATP